MSACRILKDRAEQQQQQQQEQEQEQEQEAQQQQAEAALAEPAQGAAAAQELAAAQGQAAAQVPGQCPDCGADSNDAQHLKYNDITTWVKTLASSPALLKAVFGWPDRRAAADRPGQPGKPFWMADICDGLAFCRHVPPDRAGSVLPVALIFDGFQPFVDDQKYTINGAGLLGADC